MKDLKELSNFLGFQFDCSNKDHISMCQTKYIEKLLKKFQMIDCKPKSTPCDLSVITLLGDSSEYLEDSKYFREIVGCLIYVMTCTRPDLCYIVTKLSEKLANPTKAHLSIAKHVLRYLKYTIDQKLTFEKSSELKLSGYTDSDWASSDDRLSIAGYCYKLSNTGPLISWKSKKQKVVALSSCEAEYMALTFAIQEAKFLRQLLCDMTGNELDCVSLFADNQGAIALANNPVHHQRSKHIDIRYHFIRSEIQTGIINLQYISSENNVADVFTKPASKLKLSKFTCINGNKV